jgi:predicted O-linked N-acetylglucosamine transferase (SPINDLY family)
MGVPVITLAGRAHVSRVGASLLTAVGLPELIADSSEAYLAIARRLACDRPWLEGYRASLREMMTASPLMDVTGFTRNLEHAYRQMWQHWCAADQKGQ